MILCQKRTEIYKNPLHIIDFIRKNLIIELWEPTFQAIGCAVYKKPTAIDLHISTPKNTNPTDTKTIFSATSKYTAS